LCGDAKSRLTALPASVAMVDQ